MAAAFVVGGRQMSDASEAASETSSVLKDLPGVVQRFWSGVAAPLFELAATVLVLALVFGLDRVLPSNLAYAPQKGGDLDRAIELYGLGVVIPIAFIIVLLGLAQANSWLLRTLGEVAPLKLERRRTVALARTGRFHELQLIWGHWPQIADIKGLDAAIDAEVKQPSATGRAGRLLDDARALRRRADTIDSYAKFSVGLITVAVAAGLIASALGWGRVDATRVLLVVVFGAAFLLFLTTNRIRAERDYANEKLEAVLNYLEARTHHPQGIPQLTTPQHATVTELRKSSTEPAWELTFAWSPAADLAELWQALPRTAVGAGRRDDVQLPRADRQSLRAGEDSGHD